MRAVALDLLIRRDGAEDYFGELAHIEGSIGDAPGQNQRRALSWECRSIPNNFERFFNDSYREMGTVVDQSSYVVFRHLGKLFLKDAFETSQNYQTFPAIVVVDNPELDLAIALLRDGGLFLLIRMSRFLEGRIILGTFSGKGTTLGFPAASGVTVLEWEFFARLLGLSLPN